MSALIRLWHRLLCVLFAHQPSNKGVRWKPHTPGFDSCWQRNSRCARCDSPLSEYLPESAVPAAVKARRAKPAYFDSIPTMADIRADMKRELDDALPMDPEHVLSGASEPLAPQQE